MAKNYHSRKKSSLFEGRVREEFVTALIIKFTFLTIRTNHVSLQGWMWPSAWNSNQFRTPLSMLPVRRVTHSNQAMLVFIRTSGEVSQSYIQLV